MKKYNNVIIIGGGPAGLAAAIYTARAGLKPLVFAGSPSGGQLILTSEVENYPGFESILGPELVEKMRKQAKKFGARIIDENIKRVDFSKRPFEVFLRNARHRVFSTALPPKEGTPKPLSQKQVFSLSEKSLNLTSTNFNQLQPIPTKSVIIATGAKALWLGVPGEKKLRGRGVSACATCDGFFFKDKTVAVVGGGDTALEEALTLTKFAKKVYIIHRRDQFRGSKIMQKRVLNHSKIEIVWNAVVEEVLGESKVEGVKLQIVNSKSLKQKESLKHLNLKNSDLFRNLKLEIRNLSLDGLFIAIGHKPDTELFADQVMLDSKGYIITAKRYAIELAKLKSQNSNLKTTSKNSKANEKIAIKQLNNETMGRFNFQYQSMTSVSGVFAAGDCVDYIYRQAGTAAGMGIAAALDLERWLNYRRQG